MKIRIFTYCNMCRTYVKKTTQLVVWCLHIILNIFNHVPFPYVNGQSLHPEQFQSFWNIHIRAGVYLGPCQIPMMQLNANDYGHKKRDQRQCLTYPSEGWRLPFQLKNFYFRHAKRSYPMDTGRKLNVHKTFSRRPGRLLNLLCMFNLRPVSTG